MKRHEFTWRFNRGRALSHICVVIALISCGMSGCDGPRNVETRAKEHTARNNATHRKRGANVPWRRYEAEDARSNGDVSQASRAYLTPESEASGRRLVRLRAAGEYVEFTLTHAGNGLVVRYGIPDSDDGAGTDATLGLYMNGER